MKHEDYNDLGAFGGCLIMLMVSAPALLIFYLVFFGPPSDPNKHHTPYLERGH